MSATSGAIRAGISAMIPSKNNSVWTSEAVRALFAPVAPTYRRVNRILTFGLDGYWRRRAARRALQSSPAEALDVCTGTGEMAELLQTFGRNRVRVTAVDFCETMLLEAARRPGAGDIRYLQADALNLPFPQGSFDVVTIAFALRNLRVSEERFAGALRECRRVLRPGGRLVTVETTQPPGVVTRRLMHCYVRWIVPQAGAWLSGMRAAYAYLAATIPRFYDAPTLSQRLIAAGFQQVKYTYLTCGLVAIHEAA